MKCIVLGYKGFIGQHLYRELVKRGHEVKGFDIKDGPSGDIRNLKLEDFQGIDYVFHMAAASGSLYFSPNPTEGVNINCSGTLHILELARQAGVKKLIFSSTGSSYADTPLPHEERNPLNCPNFYTATKILGEQACKLYNELYGLNTVILRYASVYGTDEDCKIMDFGNLANVLSQFIWSMMKGQPPELWFNGEQSRDFIFVDDIVYANIFAAENLGDGKVYNIGTGIETNFKDLIEKINNILGTKLEPKYIDCQDFLKVQKKYVQKQLFNYDKIKKKGWNWTINVDEGIKRIIDSIKARG